MAAAGSTACVPSAWSASQGAVVVSRVWRHVGGDDGRAAGQGLGHGDAVALGEAGRQQAGGAAHQPRHLGVRQAAAFLDQAGEVHPLEQAEHVLVFPAAAAHHQQARRAGPAFARELPPHLQGEDVVLPRLDGADHQEIGRAGGRAGAGGQRGGRQVKAQAHRLHRRLGQAHLAQAGMELQRHMMGGRHHAGRERGDDVQALGVLYGGVGAAILGVGQRDQVMQHGHEARAGGHHARDGRFLVNSPVRDDEEDAVPLLAQPLRQRPAPAAPQLARDGGRGHGAEAGQAALLARRHHRIGLGQQGACEAIGQGREPAPGRLRDEGDRVRRQAPPVPCMRDFDTVHATGLAVPCKPQQARNVENNVHSVDISPSCPQWKESIHVMHNTAAECR